MRRARSDAHWHIPENLGTDAVPIRRVTDEALQCGGGVEPVRAAAARCDVLGLACFTVRRTIDSQTFGILASHPVLLVADPRCC
jgi:hypothetical protein